MNPPIPSTSSPNGATSSHELFVLTDEQIMEIEPLAANDAAGVEQPLLAVPASNATGDETIRVGDRNVQADRSAQKAQSSASPQPAQAGVPVLPNPPAWLSRQMNDPWVGEEARELWENALRSQNEAAEYRAAIATPAEAKSLKEIYPGGLDQARAAAERARALDEFDSAYFGGEGKSAPEVSAGRTALAQRMLQENPAAFREMVVAGVEALRLAGDPNVAPPLRAAPSATTPISTAQQDAGLKPGATQTRPAASAEHQAHLTAYSEFEKSANADLEKTVSVSIDRALRQALPNAKTGEGDALSARLSAGVRQEIEKALQGDRQLGEQVAQVLASRRFDDASRAQVVRLINDRAQQLVPTATKRVLNDWTQTTLAAHRAKTEKQETAVQRADLAPAQQGRERAAVGSDQRTASRAPVPPSSRGRLDYKKLSDEQILEL